MNTASTGIEGRARWSLRLFGGFELSALPGGERVTLSGKRERVLLAYLALNPNFRLQRRKLVTLLWGDDADETTLDNLRNCLWGLRKALGDTEHRAVSAEGEDIVLDTASFEVDALTFRRLAAQSDRAGLEAAATLYSGQLLDGLDIGSEEFESWRRTEASRYRDQAINVLTRLMTQLSDCGESERAIETGERILQLEPLHEAVVRRLMRHYAESGRRSAAIQLYRTLADALRTELDAQPEAETRLVFAEIARGGEERASSLAAEHATLAPRSTSIARQSDAPIGPPRPTFRLRTPLAVLVSALIVIAALISYRQFAPVDARPDVAAELTASADSISIAVLPFLNLSGDASQEFFSDGMTEEITSALAMVSDLRVVARTSAFQFKGEKNDVRAVGQALNATHLVEGSVRKDGNRVRISAQLIEAGSGTHLWSENYDRQLSDIFATQEEIARTIVGSLMAPLGLAPGENLVSNRTIDPESYQQYLRAKPLVRARNFRTITEAAALLEQVVARDPDYAPGWALLAEAYAATPNYHPAWGNGAADELRPIVDASLPRAEATARRAIQLNPGLADGYLSLGLAQEVQGKLLSAEELYSKALTLDPNNPDALHRQSGLLAAVGRLKESLAMRQHLQTLEPFVPVFSGNTATVLWLNGQNDAAIAILKTLPPNGPGRTLYLPRIYASMGRYSEAADAISARVRAGAPEPMAQEAGRILRTAPAAVASPQTLPRLGYDDFVYLFVGAPSRVLEFYEGNIEAGYLVNVSNALFWHPSYAPVRKLERFKAVMRANGLVDYWRVKGWPEFCRPQGADDFVCV